MTSVSNVRLPANCQTLLSRLQRGAPGRGRKLAFSGVGARDVYNISAPFQLNQRQIIAGRVEAREVEDSEIVFFQYEDAVWQPVPGAMTFKGLQDPSIAFVGGEIILGGVRFPVTLSDGSRIWRMEFYRGFALDGLSLFLTGPDMMKDIRLVELADERVGVLTRPQGKKGGRGRIGFWVAHSLEAISAEAILKAPLFADQCQEDEWLGANEAHLLANGLLGVLGHIACFDSQDLRHYYPMVFCVNPRTGQAGSPEIIASRADFPPGPAKRADLVDVMFSGGLVRHGDGTATLYAGLSDAEAGSVHLPDPFKRFEESQGETHNFDEPSVKH